MSAKERLVIGMIDYMKVVDETFETSHLMEKAEDILLISYLWVPDTDPLDYRVELVEIVSMPGLPEGDLAQIKADWETVVNKICDGRAHELSGSDTLYLEACTKSSTSKTRRKQPYSSIPAKPRPWPLRKRCRGLCLCPTRASVARVDERTSGSHMLQPRIRGAVKVHGAERFR